MATQREFTAEDVQKKLQQLPAEVKSLMYSDEMTTAIQRVGEKNKLHYDQMGTLELETKNVMLGFTDTADFSSILAETLSIKKEEADTVASDVNNELFVQIREAMKKNTTMASIPEKDSAPVAMSMPAAAEKSVVMPSTVAKTVGSEMARPATSAVATPAPSAPVTAPTTPSSQVVIPAKVTTDMTVAKPAGLPAIPQVDAMLSKPTVSIAPQPATAPAVTPATPVSAAEKAQAPTPPPIYKTDPYHEPLD